MKNSYKRLSHEERVHIAIMLSHKKSYGEIARKLNRNKSTIQRDVVRFSRKKYCPMKASMYATNMAISRRYGKAKIICNKELENKIIEKIFLRWSPHQISVFLRMKYPKNQDMQVSPETIYLYVYLHSKKGIKEELIRHLRQKRKWRGNVRRGKDKRTTIVDPIRIDERPKEVLGRKIPGHWEGDLIMGKNHESAIGTLVERTTRTIIIVPLKSKDATTVRKAFEKEFRKIPKQMKLSLTYDNGSEMAEHKMFTKQTKIKVYFTHPYSPWERPTNENSNGLVRDYFPKGTDFSKISPKRLKEVQNQLNERPRNVLNWKTPKEVFAEKILQKMN